MTYRLESWLLLVCCSWLARGADWPQWRGLNRDGATLEQPGTNWGSDGPKLLWRASLGTGFSSIAVSQGRAYSMGNTNNHDTVWCLDPRSGAVVWSFTYAARLDPQWYEGGPGATPTVQGGRVFTISKWGDVFCFNATNGAIIWRRDLRQDGLRVNRWGFAGSPLLWRDLVILNAGAAGTALDQKSGRVVWSNGTNAAGYASPTLYSSGRDESVLIFTAKHLVALEPENGRELWRHFWETGWDTNITDPLVWGNRIFISSFTRGCALLSPGAVGAAAHDVVYDSKTLYNHLSPGIVIGDYLYAFNGEAKKDTDFRCIHLPSGEMKWASKDPAFGTLIRAGDQLLVLSTKGELLIVQPSPESLNVVARATVLTGTCWTPPCLANGLLYVRNARGELRCFDLKPGQPE